MTTKTDHVLIFTDLDGTVLDHDSYSPAPADAFIAALDSDRTTVIPVTSKTRVEVLALIFDIAPMRVIVTENGSVIHAPEGFPWDADPSSQIYFPGADHETILTALDALDPFLRKRVRGFSDMTIKEIAAETGLSLQSASKAKAREASEPFLWLGDSGELAKLEDFMADRSIKVQQGGRFFHLTGQCGKADAMRWIASQFKTAKPEHRIVSVALGDGPNDIEMIEEAELGVIIPNPDGKSIHSAKPSVITAPQPGPAGWVEAMQQIFDQLDSANDRKH